MESEHKELIAGSGIRVQQTGAVATVYLDNPPYNPVGVDQVASLTALVPQLDELASVRAIVVRGEGGRHFSVGANLKEAGAAAESGVEAFSAERVALYNRIEDMSKPVIAAIEGYCLGGGMELALSCHFRLAAESARLSLPEVDLGAAPMWGGGQRALRTVGRAHALDLLLTGRHVPADEALTMGLVHRVWNSADFDTQLARFAESLAAKAPLAVAAILRVVNHGCDADLHAGLAFELQEFSALGGTRDNIEGVTAMFEKRTPNFVGE